MAKSWLDVQVDLDLTRFQQSRLEEKQYADDMNGASNQAISPSIGPENWPYHVLDQQPRDIRSLLQKLHSRCLSTSSSAYVCPILFHLIVCFLVQ